MKRLRVYIPTHVTREEVDALINWHLDGKHRASACEWPDRAKWHEERRQFWGELMECWPEVTTAGGDAKL